MKNTFLKKLAQFFTAKTIGYEKLIKLPSSEFKPLHSYFYENKYTVSITSNHLQLMNQKQQLSLSNYHQNLLAQAIDSKVSFTSIDTPGWSSMVNTLKSSRTQKDRPIYEILISDDDFTGKDISNIHYTRNKAHKVMHSDMPLYLQQENRNHIRYISKQSEDSKSQKPMKLSQRIQLRLKTHGFQSSDLKSSQLIDSSQLSANWQSKKTQISKQNGAINVNNKCNKQKRFKEITVHQHLYQTSKRLQNKRAIESVLDQKFANKYVTTFQPLINSNSNKIFQQKAIKESNKQKESSKQKAKSDLSTDKQKKIQKGEFQPNKHNEQEQMMTKKLFAFLAKQGEKVNDKSINAVLQQIPLSCVRYLQKIIFTILSGKTLTFQDFKSVLDNKKLVCNKKSLLGAFSRWNQANTANSSSIAQK